MSSDTLHHVLGRRVVTSATAATIGKVKGFVFDRGARTIAAIHIDGHGRHATLLPWSAVDAFGVDAVMAAEPPDSGDHTAGDERAAPLAMLGSRILSATGRELGTVNDVEFDTATGAVVRVLAGSGHIEASRLRSLGSYALVVDDEA